MHVIVNKKILEQIVDEIVNEERSFHSKNVNELEKAAPPIFPQSQMAQQISTSETPVEDHNFVPTNKSELGKAVMQLSKNVSDEKIKKFYKNFKKLIKKSEEVKQGKTSTTHSIGEAKLPQFLGAGDEEVPQPVKVGKKGKGERDIGLIPSTPAEDMADIQGSIDVPSASRLPTPDEAPRQKKMRSPRADTTSTDRTDFAAQYLAGLGDIGPQPEWLQNVELPLSSLAVGDANKLLAAITKKIGEENITPEILEDAFNSALDEMTQSMKGNDIVFSIPSYGVTFTYNTEGKKKNLFSLDQYKEVLRALGSQKSAGTQFESSWGPKYANAIKMLKYAANDAALHDALLSSLPTLQRTLTDAVLDTYPASQDAIDPKDVASKLYVINDEVIDKFMQQGIVPGTNTVTISIGGKPVTVSVEIPNSPLALKVIEDSKFGNVLEALLSITPDALATYIAKKKRVRRSAAQMTRGQENYFYDMGMKIGGKNFKMSAADFQAKLTAAQEIVEEEGLSLSDEELVMFILLSGDIIDKGQYALVTKIKDVLWTEFQNSVLENSKLEKQMGGPDNLFSIVPNEMSEASTVVLEIFDDFCEKMIKAFTDKSVKNKLFDVYDNIVDNPATKQFFKDTAGTKHSQIYDQPGAGRRAKDVSNFVGNLRHISSLLSDQANAMIKKGSTIDGPKVMKNAKMLIDPDAVEATLEIFIEDGKSPLLLKALEAPAKDLARHSLTDLTGARKTLQAAPAQTSMAPAPEATPEPVRSYTTDDVNKTIDDIINVFKDLSADKKEEFISDFDVALEDGPSARLLSRYPALTTAKDYQRLVDQLMTLSESLALSLITRLIREHIRR